MAPPDPLFYIIQMVKHKYLMELRMFQVDDMRYKAGVNYALLFLEKSFCRRVLMNNHDRYMKTYLLSVLLILSLKRTALTL